jgi:dihydropteroate synthase/2-amino-4-hydroxy-6-hydroxymethyldihydropteridine diphosphokinase
MAGHANSRRPSGEKSDHFERLDHLEHLTAIRSAAATRLTPSNQDVIVFTITQCVIDHGRAEEVTGVAFPVVLGLGTNLGNRIRNLQEAIDALGRLVAFDAISPTYRTAPWGIEDQPDFLNICVAGQTLLEPLALLGAVKDIERRMGREPGPRYGPRLIDVDILAYGRQVIDSGPLQIPHPRLAERAFVLFPMADVAPKWVHPITGQPLAEMLAGVDAKSVERLVTPEYRLYRPGRFAWGVRTYVMGIVNVTPDSFSGDGLMATGDWIGQAVAQAVSFAGDGADIIDVGGESTRPGSVPLTTTQEMGRVIPAIEAIRAAVDVPISVDTYRALVAREALAAGAGWVNDVWGFAMDPGMAEMVAEVGCPVVLMHNRSQPKNVAQMERLGGRYVGIEYGELMADIRDELQQAVNAGLAAGVSREQIIVDPGIGFGKTVRQNRQLVARLGELKEMGFPLLVGPSRKSFIGYTLDLPPDQRLEGTAATVAIAIDRGADVVRVHDVKEMVRVARMTDSIVR